MQNKLLLSLLSVLAALPAAAATRTWDGGDVSSNWSAQNNWNGNTPVAAGDRLIFPAGLAAADKTATNNFPAGTLWNSVAISEGGYTISGGTITTSGDLDGNFTGAATVNAGVAPGGNIVMTGGGTLTFGAASDLLLKSDAWTQLRCEHTGSRIVMNGDISGSGGNTYLDLRGPGRFEINSATTFTAPVSISSDTELTITHSLALGNLGLAQDNKIRGTLRLAGAAPLTVNERFSLDGPVSRITSETGTHALLGNIGLYAVGDSRDSTRTIHVPSGSLTITGVVGIDGYTEENGVLLKSGPGMLTFGGINPNGLMPEIVRVSDGVLRLSKSAGTDCLTGFGPGGTLLQIGNSGGTFQDAEIRLGNDEQISDETVNVAILSDGLFNLNGHDETIRSLTLEAPARITTGAGVLRLADALIPVTLPDLFSEESTFTGNLMVMTATQTWALDNGGAAHDDGAGLRFTGSISGALPNSTFVKTGEGSLTLTGNHTIPRIRLVEGMNFCYGHSPVTDIETDAFWFIGSGSVRDFTLTSGTFVIQPASGVTAALQCRNLTLTAGSKLSWSLEPVAPVPGVTHDLITATGSVNIGGAELILFTYGVQDELELGDELIVIRNNGSQPVSGEFAGLPEGSIIQSAGRDLFLSYQGGSGNDVTLTYIVPPTGVTRVWDGGSVLNSNWSTAANWVGDIAPQPGDALRFPATAARRINSNDFPAGSAFHAITVLGSGPGIGYSISGNRVVLNEKLDFGTAATDHHWAAPLTLALDATVTASGNAFIQVGADIDLNGHALTLHRGTGTGDTYFGGEISGPGSVHKTGAGKVTYYEEVNTYTGATWIHEGVLALKYDATLGSTNGATVVKPGAVLELRNNEGDVICNEVIDLGGAIRDNGGTFAAQLNGHLSCYLTNDSTHRPTIATQGDMVTINGPVSGASWHKTGPGLLVLAGSQPNDNAGGVHIESGELRMQNSGGHAVGTNIILAGAGQPAKLTLAAPNQIADQYGVTIHHPGAVFDIGTQTETLNVLEFRDGGTLTGAAASRLIITERVESSGLATATAVIAAPIAHGAGGDGLMVIQDGPATPDLRIESVVYGATFRKSGDGRADFMTGIPQAGLDELDLQDGSALFFANCRYTNITLNGGLLGGQGTVGNIIAESGGVISPGASPGALGGYKATWNHATILRMELNGSAPGSEYDQYAANAKPDLGGAKLELSTGFDPAPGAEFMIIRNVSGEAVDGTFAGIPQDGYVSAPGAKVFRINYAGGDGDDVTLTRVETTAPEILAYEMTPGPNPGDDHQVYFEFKGILGLTYLLESSTDLDKWNDVKSESASIPLGQIILDLAEPAGEPRKFYRLRLP